MTFANEMRDFIGGWSAVSEIKGKKDGLDLQRQQIEDLKEYRDATLAMDQAKMDQQNSQFNQTHARRAIAEGAKGSKSEAAVYEAIHEGLGSADTADYSTETSAPADDLSMDNFARGGMVRQRHMAGGGLLEEDPDLPFIDPQNPYVDPAANERLRQQQGASAQAIPEDGSAITAAPAEAPAEVAIGPNPEAAISTVAGAQEATAAAAPLLIADASTPPAAVGPGSEEDRMDIANNQGGLSNEEWQSLVETIDPNGAIPDYLKSAAVLSSAYKYFLEKGQPEKAARVAKGILIANKQMTQTLGALAVNAMEGGDVEGAAQLVSDAANRFPTGHQFSVQTGENGLTYSVKENGKVVDEGKLSTDQFWQLAGKVKDGSLYIEEMGRFADAYGGKNTMTPEKALDVVSDSYVAATSAKQAYEDAELNGVSGKELEALRAVAVEAVKSYKQDRTQAMKMGAKRTDIDASNKDALTMAIPDGQTAAPAPAGEGSGFLGTAMDVAGRVVNPLGSAIDSVKSGYDYLTGGEESETPTPKNEAEFNALPSGTRFVAPDGTVRTKP